MSSRIVGARAIVPRVRITPEPPNPYVLPTSSVLGVGERVQDTRQITNALENMDQAPPTVVAAGTRIP